MMPNTRIPNVSLRRKRKPNIPAKRTEYNGRVYASKIEAKRAAELDMLKGNGTIEWWLPQVTIPLGPDERFAIDFLVGEGYEDCPIANVWRIYAEEIKGNYPATVRWRRVQRLWIKYAPWRMLVLTDQRGGWQRHWLEE